MKFHQLKIVLLLFLSSFYYSPLFSNDQFDWFESKGNTSQQSLAAKLYTILLSHSEAFTTLKKSKNQLRILTIEGKLVMAIKASPQNYRFQIPTRWAPYYFDRELKTQMLLGAQLKNDLTYTSGGKILTRLYNVIHHLSPDQKMKFGIKKTPSDHYGHVSSSEGWLIPGIDFDLTVYSLPGMGTSYGGSLNRKGRPKTLKYPVTGVSCSTGNGFDQTFSLSLGIKLANGENRSSIVVKDHKNVRVLQFDQSLVKMSPSKWVVNIPFTGNDFLNIRVLLKNRKVDNFEVKLGGIYYSTDSHDWKCSIEL